MPILPFFTFGANVNVTTTGEDRLSLLGKKIQDLRKNFLVFGVTTIFLDRLVQSLTRAWSALNQVTGVSRVSDMAKQLTTLSTASGIGTQRLQAFVWAASQNGADIQAVSDLFQTLTEKVDDLRSGLEQGITDDFKRFGLTKATFQGANDGLEQFLVLTRELDKLDPQRRMAAFEKLLGGDLARTFGQLGGVQDILVLMQDAITTGRVLSEWQLVMANRFRVAQMRLWAFVESASNSLGISLIPALERVSVVFLEVVRDVADFLSRASAQVGAFLRTAVEPFLQVVRKIRSDISTIMDPGEYILRLLSGIGALLAGITAISFSTTLGAIVLLTPLAIRLGKLIEDIMVFSRGGTSLFGQMLPDSVGLQALLLEVLFIMEAVSFSAEQLMASFQEFMSGPTMPLLAGVLTTVLGSAAVLLAALSAIVRGIVKAVNVIVEAISLLVQTLTVGTLGLLGFGGSNSAAGRGYDNRLAATGGILQSLYNAGAGTGPTTTQLLLMGGGGNRTVNQTNNITAATTNPQGFVTGIGGGLAGAANSLAGNK